MLLTAGYEQIDDLIQDILISGGNLNLKPRYTCQRNNVIQYLNTWDPN